MAAPAVWEQGFTVRAYEVDPGGRLAVPVLCDWLQEAAGRHARALGWAVEELTGRGLTWVVSRLRLCVHRRPGWGEALTVRTWPSGARRALALRDFHAADDAGRTVAVASSGWLLLDLASRRPVRPPAEIEAMAATAPPRALDAAFERLPVAEHAEPTVCLTARFSDLDVNRHANNAALIRMVLDGVPAAVLLSREPAELEVEFRAEVALGDGIETRVAAVSEVGERYLHSLVRTGDRQEVLRARTRWEGAGADRC